MKSLRSRKDFSDLRAEGKTIRPCSWLLINYAANTAKDLRLGLTISAGVANSVIRNKLKRWSRDYFRQQKEVLGFDVNLVFLKQKNPKFFRELTRDEFDKALDRFSQKAR